MIGCPFRIGFGTARSFESFTFVGCLSRVAASSQRMYGFLDVSSVRAREGLLSARVEFSAPQSAPIAWSQLLRVKEG